MNTQFLYLLVVFLIIPVIDAQAQNPNLFVSAQNSQFENHFSGSMVIEVVIHDSNLRDLDQGKGEPDVTVNGKILRMTQATDGSWYAYFANIDKAKFADSTVGLAGTGLDFGVFCSRDTDSAVFGISLSDTDGFAVPHSDGLSGTTSGNLPFDSCTGELAGSVNYNNVVRNAKSINTNPNVPAGQIGLNPNAWPLIQLYSFNDVIVQYNSAGSPQRVSLEYDEIKNIVLNLDRDLYPRNAQVFLNVHDFQLNQDPTDEDSWTFGVQSNPAVFYRAFDDSGRSSSDGTIGLVNLFSDLSALGFKDNGYLSMNLGSILELQSNAKQPSNTVSDTVNIFSEIVTLVEHAPNSGIFSSADNGDTSIVKIRSDAPRGQSGSASYNNHAISILTGSSAADVSLDTSLNIGDGSALQPGVKYPVILVDSDQNINSGIRDNLDAYRDSAILPTLKIGNPITLQHASSVEFFQQSDSNSGTAVSSSVPDRNSARLFVHTNDLPDGNFEKISLNLGLDASSLQSSLIDTSKITTGTNWINYDFRSFANDLGISDFSDTSVDLFFDSSATQARIINPGQMSSQGFILLADSALESIFSASGDVRLVVNFDSMSDSASVGTISNESQLQPIIFDFFSFGVVNSNDVNNAIYRFELKESLDNSATFHGSMEYAVVNQLNFFDAKFIQTIRTIDDRIKFIVTKSLTGSDGVSISYSDLSDTGVFTTRSIQSDINTHSGIITTDSKSYGFGRPVTITLNDPDLNLKNDLIDVYLTNNNPNSKNVDTVGQDDVILLEVLIKNIRYKRCLVDGVEYGGLAASGFALVETGANTGIFEGSFKMPSKICNKQGTALISPAGGSIDVKYYDSHDSSGYSNTFGLSTHKAVTSLATAQLDTYELVKPSLGMVEEIILSGTIPYHKRGVPLSVAITTPDGMTQTFASIVSDSGSYKSIISINDNSLSGFYDIDLSYDGTLIDVLSFHVVASSSTVVEKTLESIPSIESLDNTTIIEPLGNTTIVESLDDVAQMANSDADRKNILSEIPDWIRQDADSWSQDLIADSKLLSGIQYMIENGLISTESSASLEQKIPAWMKNNVKWWLDDQISDNDFIESIQYLIENQVIQV